MEYDFTTLPASDRYRLLTSFVAPRPIALVTTRALAGHNNAAPMSFFNVFAQEPPILILGIQGRGNGREKDTMVNMRRTGEFVVNMVDRALAQGMITCSTSLSADADELALAGLTPIPAVQVDVVRVGESPCAMECRIEQIIDYPVRAIVLGRVLQMHVRDTCLDAAGRYVLPDQYQPLARLHADNYIAADNQFQLKKSADMAAFEAAFLHSLAQNANPTR